MTKHLNMLKRDINKAFKENNITFFVGAGISKLSGIPKWDETVARIDELMGNPKKEFYSGEELLMIPQIFYHSLKCNDEVYYQYINQILDTSNATPNLIHRLILLQKPKKILTTNFDNLLEKAASELFLPYKLITKDDELTNINQDPFILKVHGDLRERNIVFREEDYLNYEDNFRVISTLIKTIFATDTVIFIGYGLNDYNMKLILNWVKRSLGYRFKPPYFIHVSKSKLTEQQKIYHESRGLNIIDANELDPNENDWLKKYKLVFDNIINANHFPTNEEDDDYFEQMYKVLCDLDSLHSIRIRDLVSVLRPIAYDFGFNVLDIDSKYERIYLHLVSHLNQTNSDLSDEKVIKNIDILNSVFVKARVNAIKCGEKNNRLDFDLGVVGDNYVIMNNIKGMDSFVNQEYSSIEDNFRKAYYLAKLRRINEAKDLYKEVAEESYLNKKYLIHYFSQLNRSDLYKFGDMYLKKDQIKSEEHLINKDFFKHNSGSIFENLPIDVRNNLRFISKFGTLEDIYRDAYQVYAESKILESEQKSDTIYFGGSRVMKLIYRIQESIDFVQKNRLLLDEYSEYSNVMNVSTCSIIKAYGNQNKVKLSENPLGFLDHSKSNIELDIVDFYCMVNFFKKKDLKNLLKENDIEELKFADIDKIGDAVLNLITPLFDSDFLKKNPHSLLHFSGKVDNIITLLRYVNLGDVKFEKILKVVMNHDPHWIDSTDLHFGTYRSFFMC
jgi:hypothetical protein